MRLRRSQDLDVRKSTDLEEEGELRGYYTGLVGIILKLFMGSLFFLLFISAQTTDAATQWFVILLFGTYVLGWIAIKTAGIKDVPTYQTVLDVIGYGLFLGLVIRVVEGLTLQAMTGLFGSIPYLESVEGFSNSSLLAGTPAMAIIALAVAAVAEEMFYRGQQIGLLSALTSRYGMGDFSAKAIALLYAAGLFAVLHAAVFNQWPYILALFIGGLFYGLIFYWKKDLSVNKIAHMTVNLSGAALLLLVWLVENPAYLVLFLLLTTLSTYCFVKRRGNTEEEFDS